MTSSSLEVLAALAFTDEEFTENMMVKDPAHPPAFYAEYIRTVHNIIEKNAELEFEAIWKENERIKKPRAIISDLLSFAIIRLNDELQTTTLWDNVPLRMVVLKEAFPKLLLEKLGLETLLKRVPETYVKAIFGSFLASRFSKFPVLAGRLSCSLQVRHRALAIRLFRIHGPVFRQGEPDRQLTLLIGYNITSDLSIYYELLCHCRHSRQPRV